MTIVTMGVGSGSNTSMVAMGAVLEGQTGAKWRVTGEDNMTTKMLWLKTGRVDFFYDTLTPPGVALEGVEGSAIRDLGPFQLGIVWPTTMKAFGYMVRGDSGIKTPQDLKGKKVAYYTTPSGELAARALTAWGNLESPKDVTLVPFGTYEQQARSVLEGKSDCAYYAPISPVAVEGEARPGGIAWVQLDAKKDPDGAKRFLALRPWCLFGPMVTGVKSAIGVQSMINPSMIYATAGKDAELTYQLAKWCDANAAVCKPKDAGLDGMSLSDFQGFLDKLPLPLHQGAVRYLKEKGVWTAKSEDINNNNVTLLDKYIKTWQDALKSADAKNINVTPQNADWIKLWEDAKKQAGLPRLQPPTG